VLRSKGQIAVNDLAGGTQQLLVAAPIKVRHQGGVEGNRARGFAGLGCSHRHHTCS
jgi:hypothetical protein